MPPQRAPSTTYQLALIIGCFEFSKPQASGALGLGSLRMGPGVLGTVTDSATRTCKRDGTREPQKWQAVDLGMDRGPAASYHNRDRLHE